LDGTYDVGAMRGDRGLGRVLHRGAWVMSEGWWWVGVLVIGVLTTGMVMVCALVMGAS
jgi:hypothetical protein